MGPHLMRRPPKYVHGFLDRHGKPDSISDVLVSKKCQFMEAYEQAVAGQPAPLMPAPGAPSRALCGPWRSAIFSPWTTALWG